MSDEEAFDLRGTYLSIDDRGIVTPLPVTRTFWDDLIGGKIDVGRWLMGAGLTKESPPNWDLHPRGECIIILLSGSIDVALEEQDGERVVELRQLGDTCVVPRGTLAPPGSPRAEQPNLPGRGRWNPDETCLSHEDV